MERHIGIKGWKTLLAGFLSIIWGIGGWIAGIHDANEAMNYFISGFGILGVGHKLDKLRQQSDEYAEGFGDGSLVDEEKPCRCPCTCHKK